MRHKLRAIIGSLYVLLLVSTATGSTAVGSIIGLVTCGERLLLLPEAVCEAGVEKVSRADGPSRGIANTPIENGRYYSVGTRITLNDNAFFTAHTGPFLGIGAGNRADSPLRRAGDTSAPPLENTYWKLTVLRGALVETVDPQQEAHLILDPKEKRVSGSSGCNRLIGAYTLIADRLSFGQMAGTRMACPKSMEQEQIFLQILPSVTSWRVIGQRLVLLDDHGTFVAQFEAGAMP
jgi:heat shock protein HslJ